MTWDEKIDELVSAALPKATSLASLLQRLPNIYPIEVIASLQRLNVSDSSVPHVPDDLTLQDTLHLPLPHPLDYEWRYTAKTREDLSRRINLTMPLGTVVFIGTPSMYLTYRGARDVHLIDANAALASFLPADAQWHHRNILTEDLPDLGADLVLADPPWYPEHLTAFLIAGARLLKPNGTLLLSVPGSGTRPTIDEELAQLYMTASHAGLDHLTTEPAALQYEIPTFERNALRAAGLSLSTPWRAGDLAIFGKVRACTISITKATERTWREYRFGQVRIRVELATDDEGDPRLISIVDADILPSVSRRDARRDKATVWTSGNRIFATKSLRTLHRILAALHSGEQLPSHEEPIAEAVSQLRALIELEQNEIEERLA